MINYFSSWILSIVGILVVGVLSDFLLPNGKMQGIVKTVVGIFAMLIMLRPIKNIDFSKITSFNFNSLEADSQFVENYEDAKLNKLIQDIKSSLNEAGYLKVKIYINKDEKDVINSICVDLSELVLISENLNINKYTNIIAIIKQFVVINEEQIIFYE